MVEGPLSHRPYSPAGVDSSQSRAGTASLGSQVTTRCSSVAGLGELVLGAGVHVSQLGAK